MLETKKNKIFESIFSLYNLNLLKRRFDSFNISGLDHLADRPLTLPTIIYCNHSSWWDGLVVFQISRLLKLNSFLMMEEKQLMKYKLFRHLGAFSVNRENSREVLKSINYASNILRSEKNTALWIFPQGKIVINDLRPITFYDGIGKIAAKVGHSLALPFSIRYEFLGEFKPSVFVKIATPEIIKFIKPADTSSLTRNFERRMTTNLNELKNDILKYNTDSYRLLF